MPSRRKEMAIKAIERHGISIRFACQCFGKWGDYRTSLSCYYYQAKLSTENEIIADWLLRLTAAYKR
jgi:putative transposase